MSYTNSTEMLTKALKKGYAVGAFNIYNLETALAVIEASIETKSDVILQVSSSAGEYAGFDNLVNLIRPIAEKAPIDICLHLDHGKNYEICARAIKAGFSSVMIDASSLPFDQNVKETKRVVNLARKHNISVEAEIGELKGVEDEKRSNVSKFTDASEAESFAQKTGVNSLAIAIGTAHGINKSSTTPSIHFDIIKEVQTKMPTLPLVCHGASMVRKEFVERFNKFDGEIKKSQGILESDIHQMSVATHICKINIDTDIRLCFSSAVKEYLATNKADFNPRGYLGYAKAQVKEYVKYLQTSVLK